MRSLFLPAVHSRLATAEAVAEADLTFTPYPPYHHQIECYRAVRHGTAPIVFNAALTGDGKSLAGQLPLLQDGTKTLILYPTNELIHDQRGAVARLQQAHGLTFPVDELNSLALDRTAARYPDSRRGDAILRVISNHDLVLSNPDLFHYLMQMFYVQGNDAPDRIIGPLLDQLQLLTFDEFHLFQTPQVVSVLNALLFLDEVRGGGLPRCLFLSATPDEAMQRYLERAGLAATVIQGDYRHGSHPGAGWRTILRGTTLHWVAGKAEEWVLANVESILLPFFRQHEPGAKGAIIVNSVATALRLTAQLRPLLTPHGLTVAANTGLTGAEGRRRSYEADLLVATATVDVGVDFQINFLIFEAHDGGSFLQRLGRLGRHEGYERADGQVVSFDTFVAYALLPDFILERLFVGKQGATPLVGAVEEIERPALNDAIVQAFPQPTTFPRYAPRWGALQSAHVLYRLGSPLIRDSYEGTRQRLQRRYRETFAVNFREVTGRYKELNEHQPHILEEARRFRGGSPWQVAAIDETQQGADRLVVYDLFQLLANYQLSLSDAAAFAAEAARWGEAIRRFERAEPLAYLRLHALLPCRRPVSLKLPHEYLSDWGPERFDQVQQLKGLIVEVEGVDNLNTLNHLVSRRPFVSLVVKRHAVELQRLLALPWPFPMYDLVGRDNLRATIAFAREALLLETALATRRMGSDSGGAIIC